LSCKQNWGFELKKSITTHRFDKLLEQIQSIESSKQPSYNQIIGTIFEFNTQDFLNWRVKVKSLLSSTFGESSQYFKNFIDAETASAYTSNYEILQRTKSVFCAAKEDFDDGYVFSFRNLIQAEIFDDELEQATELLSAGYLAAAAVIAGTVLETTLRQLCQDKNIADGKLDKMNADLAKAEVYNKLIQKQITALADIRNNAAHGHNHAFNRNDVSEMINYVRRFTSDIL
jgi:Domain of unknown function (DUF4145)